MHILRTQRQYHGVVSLALVAGLLGGSTGGGPDLLGGLGGLLGIGGPSTPAATTAPAQTGGSLHMPDQRLRKGCHPYDYSYSITVQPGDDFDLEIFLTDPRGTSQASDVILSGADGYSGTKHLTICRSNTTPGLFTLHGTLYTNDGAGPTTTTPLPDTTAKLATHKKHHHKKHHKKRRH